MVSRKRGHAEMAAEAQPTEPSKLQKLRNMWQFANLAQYLNLFIDALRIDTDFDIEVCDAIAQTQFGCYVWNRMLTRYRTWKMSASNPNLPQSWPKLGSRF
jgi:hypothetical protein